MLKNLAASSFRVNDMKSGLSDIVIAKLLREQTNHIHTSAPFTKDIVSAPD